MSASLLVCQTDRTPGEKDPHRCEAGSIHLAVLRAVAPTLDEIGAATGQLLHQAGIDPNPSAEAMQEFTHALLGRLLARCVARTNCAHFGHLVGQRATIQSLGLIGRLMQHSRTVGAALRALASYTNALSRGVVASLDVDGEVALFSYTIYEAGAESIDHVSDAAIACTVNVLRALYGPDWTPSEVLLPRTAPAVLEPYRRHYRAPVRFDQEFAAIVLPSRDLDRPIAGADPLLRDVLEEEIENRTSDRPSELADDIRRVLRTKLTSNRCSVDRVAGALTMNRRTLSRHLRGERTSFRELTNEVRFETARQLLSNTEIPLGQIAAALGYSEASVFTRAFRRWSGRTPTAWRTESRAMMARAFAHRADAAISSAMHAPVEPLRMDPEGAPPHFTSDASALGVRALRPRHGG